VLSLLLVGSFALQFDVQPLKDALVQVSLKNTGSSSLTMLVWNTPFDDMSDVFRAPIFDVKHASGVSATYSGIIMKRAIDVSDFVTLRPGQSLDTVLDLTKGYHFPLAGTYEITLNSFTRVAEGEVGSEADLSEQLTQTPVTAKSVLIGVSHPSLPRVWPNDDAISINGSLGGTVTLVSCKPGPDTTRVTQADANAGVMLSGAQSNLLNTPCSSRYVKWFGTCPNATNQATATNTVNNMIYRFNTGYRADCSKKACGGKNVYAYVYPNDPTFTIHLCSVFFSTTTALCAFDSTGGTLIHEMSHFVSVGATQDYAYGQTNCKSLAISNPSHAVMNADSYEYFDEDCNTP